VTDSPRLPRKLETVRQPLPKELVEGAVLGLGELAEAARAAADEGLVPPDVLVGASLFLLASQPRPPTRSSRGSSGKRPSAVAGGVWVREQVTFHHPVEIGQELVFSGESAQRFTRRGRQYGVTVSETRDAAGSLLVSNRTTGLLRYRKDAGALDERHGRADDALPPCGPDRAAADANPALGPLRALRVGDRFALPPVAVTLEMMRARDGKLDQNPIHTDPAVARREGLAAPIAGGSHVLSFVLEALMRTFGAAALLHGAHLDVQWKGQTYAGATIEPSAEVTRADERGVVLALEVRGEDRVAMVGTLEVPFPERDPGRRA